MWAVKLSDNSIYTLSYLILSLIIKMHLQVFHIYYFPSQIIAPKIDKKKEYK